jgi:electron transfer flavoprotein alpha/beta subunit
VSPARHAALAQRITASVHRCGPAAYEVAIEGAMLAGSHWMNAALHAAGISGEDHDAMHSEFLTLGERRRIELTLPGLITLLDAIEEMRAPYVRGAAPAGEDAAREALAYLERLATIARDAMSRTKTISHEEGARGGRDGSGIER